MKILEKYKNNLFLTEEEFREYVELSKKWGYGRKKKKSWMAIVLKNIKKYSKVIKPKRFISVGGRYIKDGNIRIF
ncbi:DUF365 domain-containing protein [Methanotorris formicicus]|uniref:Uncharacterized protein n=1 Tax=Methanotorris formicicus Mc-S-70 TaxID=647171 RepID=H1L1P1_9EURY|nr:DUF365 domain-containing protein [Methanotorris formicicus]EHP83581.1 protein of unknown function DUF365 [Methanotorris formicicus Mc-S-70]